MRLVHISDLHFGAVDPELPLHLHTAILAAKPDLIAVSGDLTMRGLKHEFQEARAFLDSIPLPQLIVPGNHDVQGTWNLWERFLSPWRNYRRILQENLEPEWRQPGALVVGANSARPAGWHVDWSRGRLSRQQLADLVSTCTQADPNVLRVLVVHHPPASPPGGTPRHLLGRLREFSSAVNRAGVDLVLSGHFHRSYVQALPLKGALTTRSCVLSCVSTATSHRRKGEPNGFHVIDGNACDLHLHDWAWNGEGYQPRRSWQFRSDPDQRDWSAV